LADPTTTASGGLPVGTVTGTVRLDDGAVWTPDSGQIGAVDPRDDFAVAAPDTLLPFGRSDSAPSTLRAGAAVDGNLNAVLPAVPDTLDAPDGGELGADSSPVVSAGASLSATGGLRGGLAADWRVEIDVQDVRPAEESSDTSAMLASRAGGGVMNDETAAHGGAWDLPPRHVPAVRSD
jgi:hypothetical protein